MNEYHRKFKTNLTHIAQAGKDPLLEYKDLNMEDWPAFVAIRNSPAFLVCVTLGSMFLYFIYNCIIVASV